METFENVRKGEYVPFAVDGYLSDDDAKLIGLKQPGRQR
jgi:hypothetical protein